MRRATNSEFERCCVRSATLPPCPEVLVLGRWLCVTPFRMLCLYRADYFSNNVDYFSSINRTIYLGTSAQKIVKPLYSGILLKLNIF